jgi:uncharacterized protein YdeI (YjbR/CyaY-like superfamily)
MKPRFFATPAELRDWLHAHHESEPEVLIGLWKKHTGRAGVSIGEAVEEALCVGWIDGKGHSLGEDSYAVRFTPRRSGSAWSAINVNRMHRLIAEGRVLPAGQRAFDARDEKRAGAYSYENRPRDLPAAAQKQFKAHKAAWAWWQAQTPSYRRTATWWVVSAKREETRARRLETLIEDSAAERAIKPLRRA